MDLEERAEIRNATQRNRRAPGEPVEIAVAFDGNGDVGDDVALGPVELTIEATNTELEPARWLDDEWWTDVIQRWAGCLITVHIAPTPGALLHPVVLHQLMMLRRVTPHWRLVGHADADEMTADDAALQVARSPYHEIRFADQPGPNTPETDRSAPQVSLEELFGRVRQEQSRLGTEAPVLVRLPSTMTKTSPASTLMIEPRHETLALRSR